MLPNTGKDVSKGKRTLDMENQRTEVCCPNILNWYGPLPALVKNFFPDTVQYLKSVQ